MSIERAGERAYRELRDAIVDGELAPGTPLGEVEQAARLGVSRTPLREALARLESEGLVHPAGRGVIVSAVSLGRIRELFELREALEIQAARLAAERGDRAVFATLAARFGDVDELLDHDDPHRHGYYALVDELDRALDAAVGNEYLVAALATLRIHLVRVRRLAKHDPERLQEAAREHRVIVEALAAGDGELAAAATRVHLGRALASLLARSAEAGAEDLAAAPHSLPAPTRRSA
ncbi:MAG: GntR family transcriptional regulator [Actinomycetales bacterium]|nr:GntR family transcriptional regulator [Actinomycetales bacterium]